jgi:large subunit ribosomal protein L25
MAGQGQETLVQVQRRVEGGKNACRRIRARGQLPANVYGMNLPSFSVVVEHRRVREVLQLESGQNTVFKLVLDGGDQTRDAMIKELQRDPVSGALLHVDFVRIDPLREVHVAVAVKLVGTPIGVRIEAGILDFVHRHVQVACLPGRIPESLSVDISELHLTQHVAVGDLRPPEGVRIVDDPATILAVVVTAKVELAAPTEAAVAAAEPGAVKEEGEPEVIKKGKEADAGESSGGREK